MYNDAVRNNMSYECIFELSGLLLLVLDKMGSLRVLLSFVFKMVLLDVLANVSVCQKSISLCISSDRRV